MSDTSFIKSGDVLFQMKTLLKATWVPKFCILHRQTADEHAYMELYDDRQTYNDYKQKQKKCDIKRLELQHLKAIKTSSEKKKDGMEYMIEFKINKKSHYFLFKKESDFSEWHAKLDSVYCGDSAGSRENSASIDNDSDNEDEVVTLNSMYAQTDKVERFSVTVMESPLAKLCDIVGEMTLLVGATDVAFENPRTRSLKYSFQMCWMRRFGKNGSQQFNFQIGKKCPNGEGDIECKTDEAKIIHKLLSKKSNSNSQTVIPHCSVKKVPDKMIQMAPPPRSVEKENDEPPLPKKPEDLGKTAAHGPINIAPRHPGMNKKLPTLKPIVRDSSIKTASDRLSVDAGDKKTDKSIEKENGHLRPESYRSAQANEVTKKLEEVLHSPLDDHPEPSKKDSVKTKEDKKREKEERKERERREKEEKKEEERRLKEQEKERKQKEKESKKSGRKDKLRESEKLDSTVPKDNFIIGSSRAYEDVDLPKPTTPTHEDKFILNASRAYEDVDLPKPTTPTPQEPSQNYRTNEPVQYAEPMKVKPQQIPDEVLYDEAESFVTKGPQKVVYTQPYTTKGGVPLPNTDVYTDVKLAKGDAWKSSGRENPEFEENYAIIKGARDQLKQAPPVLPSKNFNDDEEHDDTYDTITAKSQQSNNAYPTENLYGMASATKVGKLPDVVEPEADYRTDSDDGEGVYDDPTYEGEDDYQVPSEVSGGTNDGLSAYEEAAPVAPTPSSRQSATSTRSRRPPDADIYETVS